MTSNQDHPELEQEDLLSPEDGPEAQERPEEESPAESTPGDGEAESGITWESLVESADQDTDAVGVAIVDLVNEYKEAVKARDEWEDKYLRGAAEFANAKRRAELRAENQIWAARERLLTNLLPVLDDFERAFTAIPEDEQDSSWVQGFVLIRRKLQAMLDREGVTPIEAQGKPFDPNLHQAVLAEAAEDVEPGTVLDVLQQGYLLDGRVLRPSMVKVAQ